MPDSNKHPDVSDVHESARSNVAAPLGRARELPHAGMQVHRPREYRDVNCHGSVSIVW